MRRNIFHSYLSAALLTLLTSPGLAATTQSLDCSGNTPSGLTFDTGIVGTLDPHWQVTDITSTSQVTPVETLPYDAHINSALVGWLTTTPTIGATVDGASTPGTEKFVDVDVTYTLTFDVTANVDPDSLGFDFEITYVDDFVKSVTLNGEPLSATGPTVPAGFTGNTGTTYTLAPNAVTLLPTGNQLVLVATDSLAERQDFSALTSGMTCSASPPFATRLFFAHTNSCKSRRAHACAHHRYRVFCRAKSSQEILTLLLSKTRHLRC